MKNTNMLTWLLNIHLLVLIFLIIKYTISNIIITLWFIINTIFNFWFYHNIREKEKSTKDDIDLCNKPKGQWE